MNFRSKYNEFKYEWGWATWLGGSYISFTVGVCSATALELASHDPRVACTVQIVTPRAGQWSSLSAAGWIRSPTRTPSSESYEELIIATTQDQSAASSRHWEPTHLERAILNDETWYGLCFRLGYSRSRHSMLSAFKKCGSSNWMFFASVLGRHGHNHLLSMVYLSKCGDIYRVLLYEEALV